MGRLGDVRDAVGAGSEAVDLGGAYVVPGFHDAHLHLATGAVARDGVDLSACTSEDAAATAVGVAARGRPEGEWIAGFGWDQTRWPGAAWPGRRSLDRAAPANPVVLSRVDTHAVWVNSTALRALRIGRGGRASDTPEVPRDPADGEPVGILLERTAERAVAAVPPPGDARRRAAIEEAMGDLARHGITSVEDVTEPWSLPIYAALRADGRLTARISAWLPDGTDEAIADELRRRFPADDPWISAVTRKYFLDGTLGSRSAALRAPYADEPASSGVLREDPADLGRRVGEVVARGWTVAMHAIGDRALALALDVLESLPPVESGRPHRVEHVQVASPHDLSRFRRTGTLASIQPVHLADDRPWVASRLGSARNAVAYPWRSLLDAGADVAIGTDWPIAPMDPLRGIASALTRGGSGDPSPDEALTVAEALDAYTAGSAKGRGSGGRLGAIRAGFHADFAVLSADPASVEPARILDHVRVLATYVAARRVHPRTV